jgi:hypothetical protein
MGHSVRVLYLHKRACGRLHRGRRPLPPQMDGFVSDQQTSRVGADLRYTFAPGQWLWGSASWAHLVNGNRPTISGQSIGLFGTSAPGITGAPDWTELTEGSGLVATEDGLLLTQLSTSENLRD